MTTPSIIAEQAVTPTVVHALRPLPKQVHEDGLINPMHDLLHSVPWQTTAHLKGDLQLCPL